MYLDLTTMKYRYTKLLAPRLHEPVPKCKAQIAMTHYNVITMKKTKVRTTDVTPMTCTFLCSASICTGFIYKKSIK